MRILAAGKQANLFLVWDLPLMVVKCRWRAFFQNGMKTETSKTTTVLSGNLSQIDGLRDFFEELVSSEEVKRSILRVESEHLSGVIAIFCSRYIIGAQIDNNESVIGFEAARQLLALRDGSYNLAEATADEMAHLRTSLAVDIFSLLDWSAPRMPGVVNGPPALDRALDGVVESFAQTMTPMDAAANAQSFQEPQHSAEGLSGAPSGGAGSLPVELQHNAFLQQPAGDESPPPLPYGFAGNYAGQTAFDPFALPANASSQPEHAGTGSSSEFAFEPDAHQVYDQEQQPASRGFSLMRFDPGELDSIPTPSTVPEQIVSEADYDSWKRAAKPEEQTAPHRRVRPITDKERLQVGEVIREHQRTRSVREFLRVPKPKQAQHDPLVFLHKEPPPAWNSPRSMMAGGILLATYLAAVLVAQFVASVHEKEIVARGTQRLASGDKLGALLDFDTIVRGNPKLASAYLNRANAYKSLGDFDNAMVDFNKVRELEPKNETAYVGAAEAYAKKFDYATAVLLLNQCLKLNPNNLDALGLRAVVFTLSHQNDKAIDDANRVIAANPKASPEVFQARGLAEWKTQKYSSAIKDYTRCIDAGTVDATTLLGRGSCYLAEGQVGAAIDDLQHALKLDPKLTDALIARAKAFAERSDFTRALADVDRAIELQHSADAFVARGKIYYQMKEDGKAIADYDQALDIEPDKSGVDDLRSAAYARVKQLKPIMAGDRPVPNVDIQPVHQKSAAAAKTGKPGEKTGSNAVDPMTTLLNDAVRNNPNDAKSRRYLAYSLIHRGAYPQAVEQFQILEGAGALGPQDRVPYADCMARSGDVDKAIAMYKQLLDGNPYDRVARANLAKLYLSQGRNFEAAAISAGKVKAGN